MKTASYTRTAIATSIALIGITGFAATQNEQSYDQSKLTGANDLRRVTEESVEKQITAKDLIGANVYDPEGEKIGTITDISTKRFFSRSDHGNKMDTHNKMNDRASMPQRNEQSDRNQADRTLADRSQSDRSQSDRSLGDNNRSADSWKKDTKNALDKVDGQQDWRLSSSPFGSSATAFISVGGLWGVGDDIVAVPLERLSYDSNQDRFTLPVAKAQVVALAEQKSVDLEEFDDADYSYSAKQSFDSEVSQIREAISSDSRVGSDSNIMVSSQDDQIVLRGTASTQEAKSRAESVAKQHTNKDVKNSIEVRKNKN